MNREQFKKKIEAHLLVDGGQIAAFDESKLTCAISWPDRPERNCVATMERWKYDVIKGHFDLISSKPINR